jgi:type 1 fimbria pilin
LSAWCWEDGWWRWKLKRSSSVPPITVPANQQVGQVIGSANGYAFVSPPASALRCDEGISTGAATRLALVNSSSTGRIFSANGLSMTVHATDVPGVGFAMMARDPNRPFMAINTAGVTLITGSRPRYLGLDTRIYFVATGPITGGTIAARNLARYTITGTPISGAGYYAVNFSNITINAPRKPTCSVTTPSVAMPMPAVAARDFRGVGSFAGSVTRNITLSCAGGTSGATRDVFITVTDQTTPANRSDVLSLTPTSVASGVALQLLRGSTLVRYGADSTTIGNPNQWLVGTTGNATVQIPLTARYIQTGSSIRPGSANGLASFTMSYR